MEVKKTVVLSGPADWEHWLFLRKETALALNIWDQVDPDLDSINLLIKP